MVRRPRAGVSTMKRSGLDKILNPALRSDDRLFHTRQTALERSDAIIRSQEVYNRCLCCIFGAAITFLLEIYIPIYSVCTNRDKRL
jgi:hypothetical protein